MDKFSQKALLNGLKTHNVYAIFRTEFDVQESGDEYSFINLVFSHRGYDFSLFPEAIELFDGKPDLKSTIESISSALISFKTDLDLYVFETHEEPESDAILKQNKLFDVIEQQTYYLGMLNLEKYSFVELGNRQRTLENIELTLRFPLRNGSSLLNCYLFLLHAHKDAPLNKFYNSFKDGSVINYPGLYDYVSI